MKYLRGKLILGEEPEVTAVRELEEETGYGAKEFTYIQSFATSPGFADEVIHMYLARDLYKIENPAAGDEDEFIGLTGSDDRGSRRNGCVRKNIRCENGLRRSLCKKPFNKVT